MRSLLLMLAIGLALHATGLAQVVPDRPSAQAQQPEPRDTIPVPPFREKPPVSPVGAALRSLLLPGWGQSAVGRRVTGAVFIFWEGITLTMTVKSLHQLHYQERTGAATVEDKRSEVQDWAVLLAFNHLLAAAEAYVSTQLWDFPAGLKTDRLPSGDAAAGIRLYW